MITVSINTAQLTQSIARLKQFATPQGQGDMLRYVATSMLPVVHDRIHVQGIASDGAPIGTYSKGYMVVRTGAYKNADKFKKGKNKGSNKNAGLFTTKTIHTKKDVGVGITLLSVHGYDKVGTARPNYHRSSDTKVIISLTRQLENDESVIAENGKYGIGFKNEENFKKSQYVEATYNKKIFALTTNEQDLAFDVAKKYVADALRK